MLWMISLWTACSDAEKTDPEPIDTSEVLEPEPCDMQVWYLDADSDGFGDPFGAMESCEALEGYVQNNEDCDDGDAQAYPEQIWYLDADGDGFGSAAHTLTQCTQPDAYVYNADDCDDWDSSKNPDDVWYLDADGDGYGAESTTVESCLALENAVSNAQDCDDSNIDIHPAASEECDYIDNDCDDLIDNEDPSLNEYGEVAIYVDADGDGFATDEYVAHACASSPLGSAIRGDCNDGDPDIYPGHFEWPDDIDSNCDGESYWHLAEDIQKGVYDAASRHHVTRRFQTGDVNNDGVMDLLVNLPLDNNNTGKAFWVDGSSDLNFSDIGDGVQVWTGTSEEEGFGRMVGVVGDLSEDGLPDVLISSDNDTVYLFNTSSASGNTEEAIWHWQLSESIPGVSQGFGRSILPVGDIDGDGFDEALVGATGYRHEEQKRGAVFLLDNEHVESTHNPEDGNFIIGSEPGYSPNFGNTLALVKDADGDGVNEVLVSAPSAAGYSTGRVFLYPVSDLLDPATLGSDGIIFTGEMFGQKVGMRLHGIDDFNGDGYADFMISGEKIHNSTTEFGKIFIVYGKSNLENINLVDADVQLVNDGSLGSFATHMISPGDMNADGLSDIVFSSYSYTGIPHPGPGIVFGIFGENLSGSYEPIETADFAIAGYGYYREFASCLAAAGDIDADGFDDFWVGQVRTDEFMLFTGNSFAVE